MQAKILDSSVTFAPQQFSRPLQLSSSSITTITEAQATVTLLVDGVEAEGKGSIYLSDLWAWPESPLSHDERDVVLRDYCEKIAAKLGDWCAGAPGVEVNSPQFTLTANAPWLPRMAGVFEPKDGVHYLPQTSPSGLGSGL
jgi:hypothetical protein